MHFFRFTGQGGFCKFFDGYVYNIMNSSTILVQIEVTHNTAFPQIAFYSSIHVINCLNWDRHVGIPKKYAVSLG